MRGESWRLVDPLQGTCIGDLAWAVVSLTRNSTPPQDTFAFTDEQCDPPTMRAGGGGCQTMVKSWRLLDVGVVTGRCSASFAEGGGGWKADPEGCGGNHVMNEGRRSLTWMNPRPLLCGKGGGAVATEFKRARIAWQAKGGGKMTHTCVWIENRHLDQDRPPIMERM